MRFRTAILGVLGALLLTFVACDDPTVTDPVRGATLESRSGTMVAADLMQDRLNQITREMALVLANPTVRRLVFDALNESVYPEHKLHFGTFLRENTTITDRIATARGLSATTDDVLATLDGIIDLEFYMPVKEHFAKWNGDENIIVANVLFDDGTIPTAFDLSGSRVRLFSADEPPDTPTLAVVPVETDFSAVDQAPSDLRSMMTSNGLIMTRAEAFDDHEGFLKGDPEFEMHVWVKQPNGSFTDQQCAGKKQASPFQYDHNDSLWTGSVRLIDEGGIGTNPVEIAMWENDSPQQCDNAQDDGRPPTTDNDTEDDYGNWGARTIVNVSGSPKVIGTTSTTVSLVWGVENYERDDAVGSIGGPYNGCWLSSGSVRFDLREPASGHAVAGRVWLDFQFGTRSPICSSPLSASITQLDIVPEDTWCEWDAIVSGGTLPYTYEWSGLFTGTGESVGGVVPEEGGTLYLTVTDADDDESSDQIFIEVDPEPLDC